MKASRGLGRTTMSVWRSCGGGGPSSARTGVAGPARSLGEPESTGGTLSAGMLVEAGGAYPLRGGPIAALSL
jgi:hypothetical protein